MSKEEFIKDYCEKSGITEKDLLKRNVILTCNCGDLSCNGFAVVSKDELIIKAHNDLYNKQTT